jgi:hypothetical protein
VLRRPPEPLDCDGRVAAGCDGGGDGNLDRSGDVDVIVAGIVERLDLVAEEQQGVMGLLDPLARDDERDPGRAQRHHRAPLEHRPRVRGRERLEVADDRVRPDEGTHRVRPRSKPAVSPTARPGRDDDAQLLATDRGRRQVELASIVERPELQPDDVDVRGSVEELGEAFGLERDFAANRVVVGIGAEFDAHQGHVTGQVTWKRGSALGPVQLAIERGAAGM